MAKNMSEIIQNISDIFSIISLVFSICCGKFFTVKKKFSFYESPFFKIKCSVACFLPNGNAAFVYAEKTLQRQVIHVGLYGK